MCSSDLSTLLRSRRQSPPSHLLCLDQSGVFGHGGSTITATTRVIDSRFADAPAEDVSKSRMLEN